MSRSLHVNPIWTLAVSGLLGAAALAPTPAHAQGVTPERALLNAIPAGPSGTSIAVVARFSNFDPGAFQPVDGETALLARVEGPVPSAEYPAPDDATVPFDGERALLGRWMTAESARTVLSADSE